jgi:hypothetical protein
LIRIVLAILGICAATPLAAQPRPASVIVRESLDPAAGAIVGQHVALRIDVLFPGNMPHPPRVTLSDVVGLQIMRFETQATTLRETIDGNAYVGQRSEFAIYARRGGTFEIPPARVTLLDPRGDVIGKADGQTTSFTVTVPAGVDASEPVVATRALQLEQQWTPSPRSTFRAGDAIVRTITRTADDVPGLAMRELEFPAPDGVRAYLDQPEIDDRENRGVVTGRRVDRVTYVFERDGRIALPTATQPWWDLGTGSLRVARAAGVSMEIAAPDLRAGAAGGRGFADVLWLAVAACTVLLAALGVVVRHLIQRRRRTPAYAERAAFALVRDACGGADAAAIYRAVTRWRRYCEPVGNVTVADATATLEAAIFSGESTWTTADSRALVDRLAALRRTPAKVAHLMALPPLNA